MAYVSVDVHLSEILDQIDDDDLMEEVARRNLSSSMPKGEVFDSLLRASDELRKIQRHDLSSRLDEIRLYGGIQ